MPYALRVSKLASRLINGAYRELFGSQTTSVRLAFPSTNHGPPNGQPHLQARRTGIAHMAVAGVKRVRVNTHRGQSATTCT